MKPDRRAIYLFLAGVLIMAGICVAQSKTDLVHGSVYYILLAFFGLWLLRHYRYLSAIGVIATVAMAVGYYFGPEHSTGALINRIFSVFTVWCGVVFTIRFQSLHQREQKYKKQLAALFENVSEAILLVGSNGKVILGNPGAEKILGYSQTELFQLDVEKLVPERFRSNHAQRRSAFMQHPVTRQIGMGKEVFALRKDQTEVPVEVSLSSYHDSNELFVIAFITDITRRKEQEAKIAAQYEEMQRYNLRLEEQVRYRTSELEITNQELVREIEERKVMEERLRKSQLMYKAVANNFPDGIIGVLDKELRYVFVEGKELANSAPRVGIQDVPCPDVAGALIRDAEVKLRPVFEGRNVQFEVNIGRAFYEVVATPFAAVGGLIQEILIVVRNISRHKKFEEDLLRSLEKEKQLNVLKSRFVTSVSHEFRTPLSTILSSVYLLENYRGEGEVTHKLTHLNRIKRSVNSLTELLDDFLSLGKLEEGQVRVVYSEFAIASFLDELREEMEAIKKKDQIIDVAFDGPDDSVMLDRTLLANILSNLLSNAIKYTMPDGTITVRAMIRDGSLRIQVADNGMGIPEKEQKHIFKRFFRAHNAINIQGTGLGLNLVRKYVRLLKGHVSFSSRINSGSTFTVTIPLAVPNDKITSKKEVYA